jgi:hypothetical protein
MWWVLRGLLTAAAFFYGMQMGRLHAPAGTSQQPACPPPPSPPLPPPPPSTTAPVVAPQPPPWCPEDEPAHSTATATATATASTKGALDGLVAALAGTGKKIHNHCTASPYFSGGMYLNVAPSTIPEDIFPQLHHPGTPAKMSFVMANGPEWPKKRPLETVCSEVYLTRTGSRASQPNKCVAVDKVAQGVESIVQSSHRYGYTALLTDQYRNDFPTEKTFVEEEQLLPPLLKELPALQKEFKGKMGEPVGPDGQRRAVVVMVANEGVMDLVRSISFLPLPRQAMTLTH